MLLGYHLNNMKEISSYQLSARPTTTPKVRRWVRHRATDMEINLKCHVGAKS